MPPGGLLEAICCPRCATRLDVKADPLVCGGCGQRYSRLGTIPVLFSEPQTYLSILRRQLTLLEEQADQTAHAIEEHLNAPDVLPLTQIRCHGLIDAMRGQMADIDAILRPLIPAAGPDAAGTSVDTVTSVLTNIHYVFRDWAWPPEPCDQNNEALALIEELLTGQPLGRAVVLGAGACRLAYDLHRLHADTETLVVDIDALLFGAAHAIVRGGSVSLREAYSETDELGRLSTEWKMSAPHGPLGDDRFHFILADGLEPPLAPGMFDTVVTPWFIDAIPSDFRDLVTTVDALLKPGGRWLSVGPLRYPPGVPIARRFSREEIFDLIRRAGFRLAASRTKSVPYLVSAQTQRGKIEWVMAFVAYKDGKILSDRIPSWFLFRHLPVPTFAGQSFLTLNDPVADLIVSAIDGQRSIEDLSRVVLSRLSQPGVAMARVGGAVRQCLVAVHPALRDGNVEKRL